MIFRNLDKVIETVKQYRWRRYIDNVIADFEARAGTATRARQLPAWALLLRSPYRSYPEPTCWFGGMPRVPPGFKWPIGKDGRPLHFIAQIDLSKLKAEPMTGARAPGIPPEGALLVFIGLDYAIRLLSARDMAGARPAVPPPGLASLSDYGFWGEEPTFNRWPFDPVPYLSRGEERPAFLPDPFATPQQWITTWGLAALEASLVHNGLTEELRRGREFMEWHRAQNPATREIPVKDHITERIAHCELMENHAPPLLELLEDWRSKAAAQQAESPVDAVALTRIFEHRTRLCQAMKVDYGARSLLGGSARAVRARILHDAPGPRDRKDFFRIAPAYRPLIETWITDWRGHRLFGLEPEFTNNFEDRRQQDPLISISGDSLLGTESEHDYGYSVWLKDDDIARGQHANGQFIRHNKG